MALGSLVLVSAPHLTTFANSQMICFAFSTTQETTHLLPCLIVMKFSTLCFLTSCYVAQLTHSINFSVDFTAKQYITYVFLDILKSYHITQILHNTEGHTFPLQRENILTTFTFRSIICIQMLSNAQNVFF